MTVWITEVERLASIFPCLTQLNRDALILQPAFPSRQITTSDPERDLNCADGVRISSSAFLEQQQDAAITSTHRAKARVIVQGFAGFERLKAEYSTIEFCGTSRTLDVEGCFQNPIYSRWNRGDITHVVFLCRFEVFISFGDLPAAFDPDFDVRAPGMLRSEHLQPAQARTPAAPLIQSQVHRLVELANP